MKIRMEHQYIGAALVQIAEHPQFTAINALKIKGEAINNAYMVNANIGILCKYASEPNTQDEYQFTFNKDHIDAVNRISKVHKNTYVVLVCVEDAEICILSGTELNDLIGKRLASAGNQEEDVYQIFVTAKPGQSLRAYTNAAGKKGVTSSKPMVIARNAFPQNIFVE